MNIPMNQAVSRTVKIWTTFTPPSNIPIILSAQITPRELTQIYPIAKSYDGNKYGTVDYFSTMEKLEEFGMNELITDDKVMDLLFNYDNAHIREYGCTKLCVISDLRRCEGHPGLAEEYLSPLGVGIL